MIFCALCHYQGCPECIDERYPDQRPTCPCGVAHPIRYDPAVFAYRPTRFERFLALFHG